MSDDAWDDWFAGLAAALSHPGPGTHAIVLWSEPMGPHPMEGMPPVAQVEYDMPPWVEDEDG